MSSSPTELGTISLAGVVWLKAFDVKRARKIKKVVRILVMLVVRLCVEEASTPGFKSLRHLKVLGAFEKQM